MNTLSQDYAHDFYADIPSEKFNLVMRGASYEKTMTEMNLNDIQKECIDFDVNIHQVVNLFHSLLNKPTYNYELHQKTEYDSFCQTLFPNRFHILNDFSFQFIEEDPCVEEDSSVISMSMNKVFDDLSRDEPHNCEMVSLSLNDTINTIGEEPIVSIGEEPIVSIASNASVTDAFQEGLELAFSEYKSLENKCVLLQTKNEHLNKYLNQQKKEIVDLKEENAKLKQENAKLKQDKAKQDDKLKAFITSFDV
jgi:FtsZ-binding cell division protein ZapB